MKSRLAAALLLCGLGAWSGAQELRGTVRDSASRQPIPGAVLMLLDAPGSVVGRNITNERGEYRIVLSAVMRRVRVVRIGFRPRDVALPAIPAAAGSIVQLDIAMRALPTLLEPVRVSANVHCPRRSDDAATFALLEQVRAGLLAIVVAREANPARLVRFQFERDMDGSSDRVLSQTVQVDTAARTTTSYVAAASATDFVQRGFMNDEGNSQVFFAPDAEVLLDDGFAAGYCFRIAGRDRSRPNQIGLGFTAADRRSGRVDIDGILWVDTVARALRDIEHRYVGLDRRVEALRPGGRVSFHEMMNGVVLIDRWSLRLIGASVDTVQTQPPRTRPIFHATENGGEVGRASWPGGYTWRAPLGALRARGTMLDGRPAAGVAIRLSNTPYRALADSNGNFEISDLVPGPYTVAVTDPRLAPIDFEIPTALTFVAARDSTVERAFGVPAAEDFVIGRCAADRHLDIGNAVLLFGRAVLPDGKPASGVDITLVGTGAQPKRFPDQLTTGTDGLFQFCGRYLQRGAAITVQAWRDGALESSVPVSLDENLTVVRVPVPPRG